MRAARLEDSVMIAAALAMALLAVACARPAVVVTVPGPGVPAISALAVTPAHVESGCPLKFRIQFEDSGRDVVRAVARWRAKTGNQRFHEGTDILPFAPGQLQGKSGGRVEVVVIPPHAGSYVYRVQLEDAQGQTSNVAEARVHVEIRPFWRRPACETPGDDTERVRRPNVQPPVVTGSGADPGDLPPARPSSVRRPLRERPPGGAEGCRGRAGVAGAAARSPHVPRPDGRGDLP